MNEYPNYGEQNPVNMPPQNSNNQSKSGVISALIFSLSSLFACFHLNGSFGRYFDGWVFPMLLIGITIAVSIMGLIKSIKCQKSDKELSSVAMIVSIISLAYSAILFMYNFVTLMD